MQTNAVSILVVLGVFAVACAGPPEEPGHDLERDLSLAVFTHFAALPGPSPNLGYVFSVSVVERGTPLGCPVWDSLPTVRANDRILPITRSGGCLRAEGTVGPYLEPQRMTVRVEVAGDETIAGAEIDGLMPGTHAILASPADGRVRAGDDILVIPPAVLPMSEPLEGQLFLLGDPAWNPAGPRVAPVRRLDGIHVQAPEFSGSAILAVWNPIALTAGAGTGSCTGFMWCTVGRAEAIGPIRLEGVQ